MRIFITRHGQVCPKEFDGSADYPTGDIPLTSLGEAQAEKLGEALKKHNFKGKILASPYRRTMQTASIAAKICGGEIYPAPPLREMFFSKEKGEAFCGMKLDELKLEIPGIADKAKLEFPWWTTYADTQKEIAGRLADFWEYLLKEEKEEDILLVCHGASVFGSMNYINCRFGFDMPESLEQLGDYLAAKNLNCNLSYVDIKRTKLTKAVLFDTSHLAEQMLTSNPAKRERPDITEYKI